MKTQYIIIIAVVAVAAYLGWKWYQKKQACITFTPIANTPIPNTPPKIIVKPTGEASVNTGTGSVSINKSGE